MKTRLVGDIHSYYGSYRQIIDGCDNSLQVGDFGIGFGEDDFERIGSHHFIRGNHDDPELCKKNVHWVPDGTMHNGIFCVGGGFSIDRSCRTEGLDWWSDEELSQGELYKVLDIYESIKPDYVVTHEAPYEIIERMFHDKHIIRPHSRTSQALESMRYIHKPKIWAFGHWHASRQIKVDNTHFVCLGINSYIDLEH